MKVDIGKGLVLDVNESDLPDNAMSHVVYIGLRNILMDAHAGVTRDEYPDAEARNAAALALAERKLEALMRGEVRVGSTREGDPVKAEMKRLAWPEVVKIMKKNGKKPSDFEATQRRIAIDNYVAKHEVELRKTAEKVVKARKVTVEADAMDLSELGL